MIEIKIKRAGAQFKIVRVEEKTQNRVEDIKAKSYITNVLCNRMELISFIKRGKKKKKRKKMAGLGKDQ